MTSASRESCQDGTPAPLTVEELLDGLRGAGYVMHSAPGCSNRQASWQLTNYGIMVPEIESGDYKVTLAREGAVDCFLFGGGHDSGSRVKTTSYEGEDLVYFDVLNVGCDMRPDPAQRAKQVARLEETLNRLAASQTS